MHESAYGVSNNEIAPAPTLNCSILYEVFQSSLAIFVPILSMLKIFPKKYLYTEGQRECFT